MSSLNNMSFRGGSVIHGNKVYNAAIFLDDIKKAHAAESLSNVVNKCVRSCVITYKNKELTMTEDNCTNNCYVKSLKMQDYIDEQISYLLRNTRFKSDFFLQE